MRQYIVLFLLMGTVSVFSQTQGEMNMAANESFKKVDKELNDVYKRILTEYKSDTVFIKNLKASQRLWISFRDAEMKVKYPDREPGYYGSIQPYCAISYLEKLTKERIQTLYSWIEGAVEGDVCSGSVKIK